MRRRRSLWRGQRHSQHALLTNVIDGKSEGAAPARARAQLEAILGEPILEFEVLNPGIPGDLASDKFVVLDLRVGVQSGKRVDVEMQARAHCMLPERVLYYAARDYGGQLRRGDDYSELTPTVSVLWIDARLFSRLAVLSPALRAPRNTQPRLLHRSPHLSRPATAGALFGFPLLRACAA